MIELAGFVAVAGVLLACLSILAIGLLVWILWAADRILRALGR